MAFAKLRTAQQYTYSGATAQALHVFVGNAITAAWTSATVILAEHDFSGWIQENFTFTATSPSEVVSFLADGSPAVPPFTLVSDVSMEAAPAPVPGGGVLSLAFFAIVFLRSQAATFLRSAYGWRGERGEESISARGAVKRGSRARLPAPPMVRGTSSRGACCPSDDSAGDRG